MAAYPRAKPWPIARWTRKPTTRARSGSGVTAVPSTNGRSSRLKPASWAAIMTAVRTVVASDPKSAHPAQSMAFHLRVRERQIHGRRPPWPCRSNSRGAGGDSAPGGRGGSQPGQGEGGDRQSDVAQCDVEVAAQGEQIDDDAEQPCGDDVAADRRPDRDEDAGEDLDRSHREHGLVGGAGDDVVDPGGEIALPLGEQVRELVEAEGDRSDGEDGPEEDECLAGSDVGVGAGVRGRGGGEGGGAHRSLLTSKR
ncbi:hypothetical protein RHRU231_550012 [Rhodococcus ruber]|uniref:Uncharacterized protein n=1 Tax=Rhodococcus ruber TaxID=1830 RepID=A0A098BPS3_9NOCA|nr:hypothetical protein RHRU231_550012 [Rhodococcus ruber]